MLLVSEGMLSMRESDRAVVIGQVAEKRLRQRSGQVKPLLARYRERGLSGLVSGRRGKPSNNALGAAARREAMELVRDRPLQRSRLCRRPGVAHRCGDLRAIVFRTRRDPSSSRRESQ